MLLNHELYVADKTRAEYAQALRRSYQEPSLLEHVVGGLLHILFRSLRQALNGVDFPEQESPITLVQPGGDRLQSSGPARG